MKTAGAKRRARPIEELDPSKPLKIPRFERFCQVYATTGDRQKALEAGEFKSRTSRAFGRNMRDHPEFQPRIEWIQADLASRCIDQAAQEMAVTRDEVIRTYREVVTNAKAPDAQGRIDWNAVCKANEGLGRSIGLFTDRKIVEADQAPFDQMTSSEIREALKAAASLMDPNELRAILGDSSGPDSAPSVAQPEQATDVPPISEAGGVPPTRH